MKKKPIAISVGIILIVVLLSASYMVNRTKTQIKELFQMNKALQEQGYYMAEFEFKMLGIAYELDKGHYYTSLKLLDQLHHQLESQEGLIKVPKFADKNEEFQFYLNLQNPKTGAFMDDSYPYCTFTGPTGNVLLHLESLAEKTGQPLKLKYPMKYLDEINTAEKMKTYLDDVATVGWIGSQFPQTSFHFARDVLSLLYEENTVVKHDLYDVSPEAKQALLFWFYENQDPETGLWGPKSTDGKLMKKDTMNTVSIMKIFVDEEGNNVYEALPLRYKAELTQSILDGLEKPLPADDELDEWHEWTLESSKSIKAITRYLWHDMSDANKEKAKAFFKYYIEIKFTKFYVPEEGSFSYYPHGEHATLDGTSDYFVFKDIGALSGSKQSQLWGSPEMTIMDAGIRKTGSIKETDFYETADHQSVNSLRLYVADPAYGDLTSGVYGIIYPRQTAVLDIVDLTPRVKHWVDSTDQVMGNWVSKEDILHDLDTINIAQVPVYQNGIPIEELNKTLRINGRITVIGFDILQVPRYRLVYEYGGGVD